MSPNEYDHVVRGPLFKKKKKKQKKRSKKDDTSKIIQAEKTEAEKKYDETQMKRKLDRIEMMASKTYNERLKEYNEHLDRAPEQNDMPKVGPG